MVSVWKEAGGIDDPGVAMLFNGAVDAIGGAMTPGSVAALRLAAIAPRTVITASGSKLAVANIATDASGGYEKCTRTNCVTLPIPSIVKSKLLSCSISPYDEIQALAATTEPSTGMVVAAAVASTGETSVTCVPACDWSDESKWVPATESAKSCRLLEGSGEAGPCGIAMDPTTKNVLTTQYFPRKLTWCADGKPVRTAYALQHPYGACFTASPESGSATSAVIEGDCLSLWDTRQSDRDGCVMREKMFAGTLYSVSSQGQMVAVAGTSNLMNIFDLRAQRIVARWSVPSKFEVSGCVVNTDTEMCFAVGTDYEVMAGKWGLLGSKKGKSKGLGKDPHRAKGKRDTPEDAPASEMKRRRGEAEGGPRHDVPIPATLPSSGESKLDHEPKSSVPDGGAAVGKLSKNHHTGFRGDARWLGVSLWREPDNPASDVLFTISESGKLYATLNPTRIAGVL